MELAEGILVKGRSRNKLLLVSGAADVVVVVPCLLTGSNESRSFNSFFLDNPSPVLGSDGINDVLRVEVLLEIIGLNNRSERGFRRKKEGT
jgi:hypothetical protein